MKILLIEDNDLIIKGLIYLLNQHEFNVDVAKNLSDAKRLITNSYDLVILDLTLPDGNGLSFYKEHIKSNIPTLVLSAKDEEECVVESLDAGIEDYIIKPFRSKELLSRINKILKRNTSSECITHENIKIDLASSRVFVNNDEVILTSLELKILLLLVENHNRIITRETILEKIWDVSGKFVEDNTLTVYIKRIREKLGSDDFIKTIKGIGYRIDL